MGKKGMNPEPQSKSVGMPHAGIDDRTMCASARSRRIKAAMALLSPQDRSILAFAYQPPSPACMQLIGAFGEHGMVALAIHPIDHWRKLFCKKNATKEISAVKTQIISITQRALRAYKRIVIEERQETRRQKQQRQQERMQQWVLHWVMQ